MAIETEPARSSSQVARILGLRPVRAWWMRPAVHTAIIGAVVGYVFGHWLGNLIIRVPAGRTGGGQPDTNDTPVVLGYLFMVIGWLIGLGSSTT